MAKQLFGGILLAGTVALVGAYSMLGSATVKAPSVGETAIPPSKPPLYRSSVVGTDFDLITEGDRSAFQQLDSIGLKDFEMPDKRDLGDPLVQRAYVFEARFADSPNIGIAIDKDFGSREAAELEAARYTPRLGKLPTVYRKNLRHIVVHKGGRDTTAFAEDKGHFFVIYSDNASKRIGTRDLEETFFHEATHASIQSRYIDSDEWRQAKARDNAFLTDYAATEDQEDFAESALFAYVLIHHPDRLPPEERARIEQQIPNRIAFFRTIFAD